MDGEMLDYAATAKRLAVKVNTLYALVHEGRIPHYKIGRRFIRFRWSEIEAWLQDHRVEAEAK